MRLLLTTSIWLLLSSCSAERDKVAESSAPERLPELEAAFEQKKAKALEMRDRETGWLARMDCDAMIWTGKYAAVRSVDGVNVEAAEYPGSPGKFGRRPAPWCWTPEAGDQGSKTEWSRDMYVAGLLPYAWRKGRLDILSRHAGYGEAHPAFVDGFPAWQMGEPLDDGRTIYAPNLIGLTYKAVLGLGGPLNAKALWPDVYPAGLVDYEAHLQVMSIWVRGEIAAALQDEAARPRIPTPGLTAGISETMFRRLEEHAGREPKCALYQAVYGLYAGSSVAAIDALLDGSECSYLRCNSPEECGLAEWLFAADLVLEHVGR